MRSTDRGEGTARRAARSEIAAAPAWTDEVTADRVHGEDYEQAREEVYTSALATIVFFNDRLAAQTPRWIHVVTSAAFVGFGAVALLAAASIVAFTSGRPTPGWVLAGRSTRLPGPAGPR